jgi:hypothetical protein
MKKILPNRLKEKMRIKNSARAVGISCNRGNVSEEIVSDEIPWEHLLNAESRT